MSIRVTAATVLFTFASRAAAQEPPTPTPEDILLIDSFGHLVAVPSSSLPARLLPPPEVGLSNQVPNPAGGGKLPPEVLARIAAGRPAAFTLFPSTQPTLVSYLAGLDELGNTLVRPGPLFPTFPLEAEMQAAKYRASRRGLRYSLRQSLFYTGLSDPETGSAHIGFYDLDFFSKWTIFQTPSTAGWLSAEVQVQKGLNSAGKSQDAGTNIGSLADPTGIWSSHEGARVPELAWQQAWRRGEFVAVIGVVDQSNYLDGNLYANDGRGQFMNSALINSMVLPLPSSNFGVNLQWQPGEAWYTILGASAGNARAGQQPWTNFSWADWSVVGELGLMPDDVLGLGPGIYRIQPFLARAGGPTQGGIAFNFRQQLGRHSPFGWFGRFGVGGSQVSAGASTQIGTGFVMQAPLAHIGLVPRLTNDVVGIGLVWSQPSATARTIDHRNEYVFETEYTLQLAPAVRLQPDFQLVWNPVFNPAAGPSEVFQLEWLISW
jgi:porin